MCIKSSITTIWPFYALICSFQFVWLIKLVTFFYFVPIRSQTPRFPHAKDIDLFFFFAAAILHNDFAVARWLLVKRT